MSGTLIHLIRLILCGLIAAVVQNTAKATPSDVELLNRLTSPSLQDRSVNDVLAELQNLAFTRTDSIAQSRGYPGSLQSSNKLVRKYIESELSNSLGTRSMASSSTRTLVVDLALEILSGEISERALAYAAFQPPPRPPESNKRLRPLSQSATTSKQKPLSLRLSNSYVQSDMGTIGSNNGILDPGEVATLKLNFINTSETRLVSSSLYIKSLSECLFTSSKLGQEIQLPELNSKKHTNIELSVYASSECSGRTGTIYMEARDTHRFEKNPLRYALKLSLSDATDAKLTNVRIDRDDYGHSEPKRTHRIQPKDRVEVSASIALKQPGYNFAYQRLLGPAGAASAVHEAAVVDFRSVNGQYVAPMHDDIDLIFPGKFDLLQRLKPIADAYGWQSINDARVYVAIDTTFGNQDQKTTRSTRTPTYAFSSKALQSHLANHLHIEVNTSSSAPTKDRIAIGAVDGFRFEIDKPGELMEKLNGMDFTASHPKQEKDDAYSVRHYIELPIFWEKTLVPKCLISVARSAKTGQSLPVSVSFDDIAVGSTVMVNGLGLNERYTTRAESENINLDRVTMTDRSSEIALQIVDKSGATVCRNTQSISSSSGPVEIIKPIQRPEPELPLGTFTLNGHIYGLGGWDLTGSFGRSFGLVGSTGRIDGSRAWTLGGKASQLLVQGDSIQLNLTESLEFGRGWIDLDSGGFSYTRASIFVSAHRNVGINGGLHFETNEYGELTPSVRLGFGGYFGAHY